MKVLSLQWRITLMTVLLIGAVSYTHLPDTFADMAGTFKERSGDVVKALCLHVAHTCNLNCSYCFASQGKYLSLIHI